MTNNPNNITPSEFGVNLSKALSPFVTALIAHDLKFLSIAFQIIED
jgi:hypothetical protein